MLTKFNPEKLIQAAAVLLKTAESRRMTRLRLLKLLYIADRESIEETGRPITGDSAVAMDHGPVLSRTYNCIKGTDFASCEWARYFRNSGQDVECLTDPGNGKLSIFEIEKLQDAACRFQDQNDWDVAEYTHTFQEWLNNKPEKGSSRAIPVRDVLSALGFEEKEAQDLLAEARAAISLDQAVARASHTATRPHGGARSRTAGAARRAAGA